MRKNHNDLSWTSDEFEDVTTRAYIALHENKFLNFLDRGDRGDRELEQHVMRPAEMRVALGRGVYIPSDSADKDGQGASAPYAGLIFARIHGGYDGPGSYAVMMRVERVRKFTRIVRPRTIGRNVSFQCIRFPSDGPVIGLKYPYTVTPSALVQFAWAGPGTEAAVYKFGIEGDGALDVINSTERHQDLANANWRIRLASDISPIDLGCSRSEVKSLLYARQAPMTEAGRKRPILHLVASHRRRMKEGIEIDIDEFLRGTREIEMGGQLFQVRAPQELEEKSQKAKR